jgi:zinc protease
MTVQTLLGIPAALALAATLAATLAAPPGAMAAGKPAPAANAAKTDAPAKRDPTAAVRFEKFRLANGLEVILAEDHRLPLVAFNLWVHAGPRNEAAGQTGFAHLFEHLMFAGTKHIARGRADQLIDAAGGTDSNGTTNFDRTNYFFTLPANQFELGLWIKSDMLGYMIDEVDQVALANQQDVVRNERRQTTENRPYGVVDEAVYAALFPPGHPYRAAVIGSHADIQSIRLDDVRAFARTYYRPNNATLVLAGDFDPRRARELVQRYFGSLSAGAAVPPVQVAQPVVEREKRVVVPDRVELPRVTMAWHTPAAFQRGDADLDIAASVLGGGKASRLYKKLVYELQLAQSVEVGQESLSLGSVFSIEAVARPGHTLPEIEAVIDQEIAKLSRQPPSAAEMQRARAMVETRVFRRLEKVGGLADQLNFYNQYTGDPGYLQRDLERYRRASPEGVRAVVAAQLLKDRRVVVHGVPGTQVLPPEVPTPAAPAATAASTARESLNADESWRATQPAPTAATPLRLPDGTRTRLPNGLTVVQVVQRGVPLVSARLVVLAGQDRNPPGRPGLAGFTSAMLEQGTRTRSAQQVADSVADLGALFAADFGPEDARLGIASLSSRFPAALDLLADVALNPAFAEAEVARQKQARADALLRQRESITRTADVVGRAAFYGPGHPLAGSALGDEAAINATTRAELQAFWRQHFRPDQAALIVSGDIAPTALLRLVKARFGAWRAPAGGVVKSTLPAPQPSTARVVLVDKPGASQTAINVVAPGPAAGAPDAAAVEVMNNALGGLFTSRINQELREVKGYTYGVYTRFAMGRSSTHWGSRGSVRGDVTGPALAEMFAQIKAMRATPMGSDELLRVRNAGLLSLPGEFDTNDAITARLANAWSQGQPADYFARWPGRVAAVDAGAAFAAAQAHVKPETMTVIAVGDLAKVRAQIEALNLGAVEVRDADGRLKP